MHRAKKTVEELETIGLQRIRSRPGCRGVASLTITLDEDGEWSFGIFNPGAAETETVQHAVIALGHQMHDEYELATDT